MVNTVEIIDSSNTVSVVQTETVVTPTTLDVTVVVPDETVTLSLDLLAVTITATPTPVSVTVDSLNTRVVTVGVQGPQGPTGPADHKPLVVFIASSTIVQTIPLHDGTASTEITVLFGPANDGGVDVTDGIMTALVDLSEFTSALEVHAKGDGPGGQEMLLTMWAEYSADAGVTWNIVPDSLHSNNVRDLESNSHSINISQAVSVPAGTKFRLRATKLGATNTTLILTAPPDLVTSNGLVSGTPADARMFYRVAAL